MLPFSTLKERVSDILKPHVCSPSSQLIPGINLFCGKMLYLIGMFKMPCVIVPTCLIELKKALL